MKNQGAEDAKVHHSCKNFGTTRIVFAMFFGICWIRKTVKERIIL